jgi:hypothetical protein
MPKKQPTINDFNEATPKELMKTYKLDQRGLENAQRRVMDGAGQQDFKKAYEPFYRRNRRDA